jgi:uncharacterized protein (TIGR02271 family)
MTTMQRDAILQKRGEDLLDRDGNKIGGIQEIYLDTDTNEPEWALVNTGLFGSKSTFVPLRDASEEEDGLRVPYDKSHVKEAPRIDPDGRLSAREEADLYRHYEMEYPESSSGAGTTGYEATTTEGDDVGTATGGDEAMTRSEEELRVGTTERETGRVRLRKYVETEDVEETVPVQRQEARVVREPITDANVDEARSGPDIAEDEHEVVLHEEEAVVEKRAVPKERVRLETGTVTDEKQISDTVRKERIDVDESEQGSR